MPLNEDREVPPPGTPRGPLFQIGEVAERLLTGERPQRDPECLRALRGGQDRREMRQGNHFGLRGSTPSTYRDTERRSARAIWLASFGLA